MIELVMLGSEPEKFPTLHFALARQVLPRNQVHLPAPTDLLQRSTIGRARARTCSCCFDYINKTAYIPNAYIGLVPDSRASCSSNMSSLWSMM